MVFKLQISSLGLCLETRFPATRFFRGQLLLLAAPAHAAALHEPPADAAEGLWCLVLSKVLCFCFFLNLRDEVIKFFFCFWSVYGQTESRCSFWTWRLFRFTTKRTLPWNNIKPTREVKALESQNSQVFDLKLFRISSLEALLRPRQALELGKALPLSCRSANCLLPIKPLLVFLLGFTTWKPLVSPVACEQTDKTGSSCLRLSIDLVFEHTAVRHEAATRSCHDKTCNISKNRLRGDPRFRPLLIQGLQRNVFWKPWKVLQNLQLQHLKLKPLDEGFYFGRVCPRKTLENPRKP